VPELGYLPFELQLVLPSPQRRGAPCPPFVLSGLRIDLSPGMRPSSVPRPGFTFSISGCDRHAQSIERLELSARGYGNLQVSFATLRDSPTLLSIEPSHDVAPTAGDAFSLIESDVRSSRVAFFGDVTGNIGETVGRSQNGSRATDTVFAVANPETALPKGARPYIYRKDGDGYRFSWYGAYPQEWGSAEAGFAHLSNVSVQYIRDVQLGSVNVSASRFAPWTAKANPIFRGGGARPTANPPAFDAYNMDMDMDMESSRWGPASQRGPASRPLFGCNLTDVVVEYLWDVDLLRSACTRCRFEWVAAPVTPAGWTRSPPPNPSFWVNLQSDAPNAGFRQVVNDTLACMRPMLVLNGSVHVSAQQLTTDNHSFAFGTTWAHVGDAVCHKAKGGVVEE